MVKEPRSGPGSRGLSSATIVEEAVAVQEEVGPEGFSLRKVATRVGCDPMAVLYHLGSRDNLERAMAEHLNAQLRAPDREAPWRDRLTDLAQEYRALALRYPRTFPLLLRFWITGPADYEHAEAVYQALTDAGLADPDVVDACCGWYAAVLGLAASEAGGMLRPATSTQLAEVGELAPGRFPRTTALLPHIAAQRSERTYAHTVGLLLDGIEHLGRAAPHPPAGADRAGSDPS